MDQVVEDTTEDVEAQRSRPRTPAMLDQQSTSTALTSSRLRHSCPSNDHPDHNDSLDTRPVVFFLLLNRFTADLFGRGIM